jgi:hypothetical protein
MMRGVRWYWFAACIATLSCIPVAGREWTDNSGRFHIEAEFVDFQGQTVQLKKANGATIRVLVERLSKSDQDLVKRLVASDKHTGSAPVASFELEILPLLKKHCVACHGPAKAEADVNFSAITNGKAARKSLTLWRKAAERIENGEMPPKDEGKLDAADHDKLLRWMKHALRVSHRAERDPGPALTRRLSRAEYEQTIRALTGIEFDAAEAVGMADESRGYGFANQADVLTLSPALIEKYFAAADQTLDLVLTFSTDEKEPPDSSDIVKRPAQQQGAKPPTGRSPTADAAKSKLAVQYRWAGNKPKENQLRPHFQIVNQGQSAVSLRDLTIRYWFTAGGPTEKFQHWCDYAKIDANNVSRVVSSLSKPVSKADAFLEISFTSGNVAAGSATGEIQIRVAKHDWKPFDQADDYSFAADVKQFADARRVTLYRQGELVWGKEPGVSSAKETPKSKSPDRIGPEPRDVSPPTVEVSPVLAKSRDSLLKSEAGAGTSERDAARTIVTDFVRRAWRRPVRATELKTLLAIYDRADSKGASFPDAVRPALKAVLVSPFFLLRVEEDHRPKRAEAYRPVNDHELAVRLSYFLWSGPPDKELSVLADQGKLSEPAELERQMRRMLADRRARALTDNFGIPWLQLTNLSAARPTQEYFPTFTASLKEAMFQETWMFIENLRQQDRSVLELLDADYTFANEELARHYNLAGVKGPRMRKVALRPSDHRGGVLGMGSVLTKTSHTYRTSPTMRGKYVLEVILGTPPQPPPANGGSLKDEAEGKAPKTFRESLERHAGVPACAACHRRIDPLGFGLENFDAVGRWRENNAELLDSTGVLPSGEKFSGPAELKRLLLDRRNQFLRNLSEQILTYALGRKLEDCDQPAVLRIQADLKKDPRFSTLVLGAVRSFPFGHRRNVTQDKPNSGAK